MKKIITISVCLIALNFLLIGCSTQKSTLQSALTIGNRAYPVELTSIGIYRDNLRVYTFLDANNSPFTIVAPDNANYHVGLVIKN